jgi:hypothetical protein
MPPEVTRIASQLRGATGREVWHGPALAGVLIDVTARQAAARPIAGAHSIWELVRHLTVWADVARRRLGGEVVEPTDAEDWPGGGEATDAVAWDRDVARLVASYQALADAVAAADDRQLDAIVAGRDHDHYIMLHGVVEHAAYHAGQIQMLKKIG